MSNKPLTATQEDTTSVKARNNAIASARVQTHYKTLDSEPVCFAAPFPLCDWLLLKRSNDLWNTGSYQAVAAVHCTEIRAPVGFCQHKVRARVSGITSVHLLRDLVSLPL